MSIKALLAIRIPNADTDFSALSRSYKNNFANGKFLYVLLEPVNQTAGIWGCFGLSPLPGGFFRGVAHFFDAVLFIYRV